MTAQHTPGPWGFYLYQQTERWGVESQKEGLLVVDCGPAENLFSEGNARLIAAAPETAAERDRLREINADLVEVLEDMTDAMAGILIEHGRDPTKAPRIISARTAIAKATEGSVHNTAGSTRSDDGQGE